MLRTLVAPRLLALHLLGVCAVVAAGWLGVWQYDAWQSGRELAARDLADAEPRPLTEVLGPDAAYANDDVGRPVDLRGTWLPGSNLEVADRRRGGGAGAPGRWVVTPVAVCPDRACATPPGERSAILVVRGWRPQRATSPRPPAGDVELTGWLQPGEGSGRTDRDPADRVIPEMRIASAVSLVDQDLYGGYVVVRTATPPAADDAGSLVAVSPDSLPEPASATGLRNLLYAVEWWVFAGFAVYLWQRWVRDELARPAPVPSSDHPDPDGPDPDDPGDRGPHPDPADPADPADHADPRPVQPVGPAGQADPPREEPPS